MMQRYRNLLLSRKRNSEKGASDIIVVLFVAPIMVFLLFGMIDVSTWLQAREHTYNSVRDAARQVAFFGGNDHRVSLNPNSDYVSNVIRDTKMRGGNNTCAPGLPCTRPADLTCTPNVVRTLGQTVSCTGTYHYQSVAGGMTAWLGFGDLLGQPITVTETYMAETFYR